MRETERQINIYKEKLPRMKERVGAALVMLLLAVVMTVSSSMAWLVLSSDPEVKGMNTTITANGNLEIALASGTTITPPKDTAIGDGSLPLVERNITWGNLVNLGDSAYGLENIVLRPATLNRSSLKESPLDAAGYGSDGRVDVLENAFAYVSYDSESQEFMPNAVAYGVRAIASVTYGTTGAQETALSRLIDTADEKVRDAKLHLQTITDSPKIQKLLDIAAKYVEAQVEEKLGSSEPAVFISVDELEAISYLMDELITNAEKSADALAAIFNVQMFRKSGLSEEYLLENKFTGEYLLTAAWSDITAKLNLKNSASEYYVSPVKLSELQTLRNDYNTLKVDYVVVNDWAVNKRNDIIYQTVPGNESNPTISGYLTKIVDVGSVTVNGTAITGIGLSNYSNFTGKDKSIVINKGIFQRMDAFTGADVKTAEQLGLSVKVIITTVEASGWVSTSAGYPGTLDDELAEAKSGTTSIKGTAEKAGDTFGMALDFFLRTNAPNAHLILQGSPVYETRQETASANIDGTTYELYNVTVSGESAVAYRKQVEGEYVYFSYDRKYNSAGGVITPDEGTTPTLIIDDVDYIVGYSGVNRVWDGEDALLDSTSTTQGAGSCYTFYAASPEDQEKSLQLLKHFRIAFIDSDGHLLGNARLDTSSMFAQSGKVTVPLVLEVTNNSITGADGETIYTITELQRNEATFITALVYLEGGQLTNDQVLAAGEIQGQLNIQFGTTTDLNAMNDPVLKEQKCSVSAVMEGETSVAFDTPDQSKLTKTINVSVSGYTPSKVEAYFLREINSTQGVRQGKITFEPTADGKFTGSYTFTSPGKYILREVILDGVTYELNNEPIVFTIEGFTISSVSCADNGRTYMLTDKSFTTSVSLMFASNDVTKMPTTVKGAFIHTETKNRTTVYFTRSQGSTWEGSATFTTTGEYVMDYVELDGEPYGLEESQHISVNLYLGLNTRVYSDKTTFVLANDNSVNVSMTMDIRADNGEEITGLENVWLQYSRNGSTMVEEGEGAKMAWNSRARVYEGTFNVDRAGTYTYMYTSVNLQGAANYLYVASTSPVLTAVSTDIPTYVSKNGFGETFALSNDASFSVTMKHAGSATVDAILKNSAEPDKEYYVRGTKSGTSEQTFTFILPIIDGKQSGTWSLEGIYMTNVFGGANNTFFDGVATEGVPATGLERDENGAFLKSYDYSVPANYYYKWWRWSLAELTNEGESADATITVVSNVNVSFTNSDLNANKEFGKTNGTVDGLFGQAYTLGNLEISVTTGSEGKPLSDYGLKVSSVKLSYAYDVGELEKVNNSTYRNKYGSYTVALGEFNGLLGGSAGKKEYSLASSNGGVCTLSPGDNNQLNVAGSYKATAMEVTIVSEDGMGEELVVNAPVTNAPVYKVYSLPMDAIFTATNPTVGEQFDVSNGSSVTPMSNSITADGRKAVVYHKASTTSDCWGSLGCGGYTAPTVTAELQNGTGPKANFTKASMIVKTASDGNITTGVEFTFTYKSDGDPSSTQTIGGGGENPKYIGTNATATEIVTVANINGNEYNFTFTLPGEGLLITGLASV